MIEAWDGLCTSMETWSSGIYTVVGVGNGPQHCSVYMVDAIRADGDYGPEDYLLHIEDGVITYNYTDMLPSGSRETAGTIAASVTQGERNALEKAKDYLRVMPFSYSGLIDQLEYEGFTYSEAVYGADNCGADWYEQAAMKAADYLDIMAFSRDGLIDQLEYEGFTYDQAVYGVEQNGY